MTSIYIEDSIDSPQDGTVTPVTFAGRNPKSSAISGKVAALLSSSFADSETRDALAILESRNVKNTAETRRRIRHDAQKEVIDCNADIVADFGKIAEQLKRIGTMIATLNNTCDEVRKHINVAKQETAPMLQEATALMSARKANETRQEVLDAFNQHFTIPDKDLSLLTSSVEPVNDRFFQVLDRVKKIHEDCEILLGSEDQTLGLEMMEQTTRNLDAAFKKLYQWIQREFKTLDLEDPHISGSIRRALRVLAERPSLFQNCLDFFAEARENTLSDAFHAALTDASGDSERTGSAKPIEFSTHDLLRYLGDMLAWAHSASVSEKESLEGLFVSDGDEIAKGIKAGKDSEPWSRLRSEVKDTEVGPDTIFDGQKALNDLVNRNLAGVCRTLGHRVEIAVRNNDNIVLIYKALQLLKFYQEIFFKLLGHNSGLAEMLRGLDTTIYNHFEHLLRQEADGIHDESVPADLSVPTFFTAALDRLERILQSASESSSTPEINRLMSVALEPFQKVSEDMAEEIEDPTHKAIFQLNHTLAIMSRPDIASRSGTQGTDSTTRDRGDIGRAALCNEIVDLQHQFLLNKSGLDTLLDSNLLSQIEQTSAPDEPDIVEAAGVKLDAFLPTAQMDALDKLTNLGDKRLAKDLTNRAIDRFCADFQRVKDALAQVDDAMDEEGGGAGEEEGGAGYFEAQAAALGVEVDEQAEDEEAARKGHTIHRRLRLMPFFPRSTAEIRLLLS